MKLPGAELLMVEIPDKRTFGHLAADWDHQQTSFGKNLESLIPGPAIANGRLAGL